MQMPFVKLHVELHRHLDVSIRTRTLLELCQERGWMSQGISLKTFQKELFLKKPLKDLETVLAKFSLFQKVFDHPRVLERVAFEACEDCVHEGIGQIEFRYAPAFVAEYGRLTWEEIHQGFLRGLQRARRHYPHLKVGLICIAVRDEGRDSVYKTVEFFEKNSATFIGIDLAGNERNHPCRDFEDAFRRVKREHRNITIHAGEDAGPENIWEAIEWLGARRIGHGIHCVRDPRLMRYLAEREICLEVCPTSNWITQAVTRLEHHPLPQMFRAGIPVTLNTDDPGIFGNTLQDEIRCARSEMGMSDQNIKQMFGFAKKFSFLK